MGVLPAGHIQAQRQQVLLAVADIVGHVKGEALHAALVIADIAAVEPYFRIVLDALEIKNDALPLLKAQVGLEDVAEPDDAGPGVLRRIIRQGDGLAAAHKTGVPFVFFTGIIAVHIDVPVVLEAEGKVLVLPDASFALAEKSGAAPQTASASAAISKTAASTLKPLVFISLHLRHT